MAVTKSVIYEYLKGERRKVVNKINAEIDKHFEIEIKKVLDTKVNKTGQTFDELARNIETIYDDLWDLADNQKIVMPTSALRSLGEIKSGRDLIAKYRHYWDSSKTRENYIGTPIGSLYDELDKVKESFDALHLLVKRNSAKKSVELLKDLGFEVPQEEEKILLPAIQMDLSHLRKWRDENEI